MGPNAASAGRNQPIRQGAADLLQEAILKGRLRPGVRIGQLEMARRLKLSQASLRESLQELESRGLVIKDGRNWRVTRLSEEDLAELYQLRAVLEPLACRLAANAYRKELGAALEDCMCRMAAAAAAKDYETHSRADMEFHRRIWSFQPSRMLERHLNLLCMPLFAFDLVERASTAYMDFGRSLRQHRLIAEVLRARDGERAERVVRRLMQRFHRQDIADFRELEEAARAPENGP